MTEDPLSRNLYAALRAGFPAPLDDTAIETDTGLHYTWRDIDHGSARLANLLTALNLPGGTRIAVQVDKSVEAMMLYLATLRAGHVFLPLNPAYRRGEMEYFICNAEPAVVVCISANFGWVSKLAFTAGTAHVFTLDNDRGGSLLQRAAHHADHQAVVPRGTDDLAAVLYTSGTTGRAKGAMLSHGNLLANARVRHDYWGWQRPDAAGQGADVLIHALPIFHVHGLFVAIHGALLAGARMRWCSRFDAAQVLRWLPGATVFMGVPTLYVRLLQEPRLDQSTATGMRLFISGSAPLLVETFRAWQARTGHTILERYGMSETGMLTSNPYRPEQGERRAGTVGFPLPGVGVRVCGDGDVPVATGEVGASRFAGPTCLPATGACLRRQQRNSRPMDGSAQATLDASTNPGTRAS